MDSASSEEKREISEEDIERLFEVLETGSNKNVELFKEAMKAMAHLESDKEKFIKLKESLNIYQILAFYLISVFPYCNYSFYREYFLLIFMITKSLNEKGEMFILKKDKRKESNMTNNKCFSETSSINVTAEILNLFIAELFPNYLKDLKESKGVDFKYLGFEDEHIKNLILMCKYLANWLFNNEFIEYRLEINVDF